MGDRPTALPLIISRIPREFESSDDLGRWITAQLGTIMETHIVRPDERALWAQMLQGEGEPNVRLWAELDELIIAQVPSLGWRITCSVLVQHRFRAWESAPNGVDLMQRFCDGWAQSVRILQRKEKPPVDPELGLAKEKTVHELRVILQAIHGHLTGARRSLSLAEQAEHFRAAVIEGGAPHLQANLDSWVYFFAHVPEGQKAEVKDTIFRKRPAELYDLWLAASTGYTRETVRQKISSLKSGS